MENKIKEIIAKMAELYEKDRLFKRESTIVL